MSEGRRAVRGRRAVAPGDTVQETVTKLIPSEVLIGYAAAIQLLQTVAEGDEPLRRVAAWVVFGIGLVFTPVYVAATWDPDPMVRRRDLAWAVPQLIVSTLAFVLWAFGLGVPFTEFGWYREWMGGLALIVGTIVLTGINRLVVGREG